MRFFKSGIVAAVIATTTMAVQGASYAASKYEVQSGTVSINFFPFTNQILQSAGQTLVGLENTVTPIEGFLAGFNILPPSNSSSVRGSNFTFDYDFNTKTVGSITGAIETTGNFIIKNDTTKLPLPEIQRIGNYTIGSNSSNYNYFLKDNLDAQIRTAYLEDRFPPIFDGERLIITTRLYFSKETSDLLQQGGAINTFGYRAGEAIIIGNVAQVPEPGVFLGMIGTLSTFGLTRYKK